MFSRSFRLITFTVLAGAPVALSTACSSAVESPATAPALEARADAAHAHDNGEKLTSDQRKAIASVRGATSQFHDINVAKAAGYTNQYPAGCKFTADGAQGFHYLNPALVDDKVELLKPELVMYEPGKNGQMQLIGVDYVVPFDKWTSPEAPTLLGQKFMRNEPLGVWALHIWAWRPNPSGMFAMWNPAASCEFAN